VSRRSTEIVLNSWDWCQQNNITPHAGKKWWRLTASSRKATTVTVEYDRLLPARFQTPSSRPSRKDLEGAIAYRDIADTNAMIDASVKIQASQS
jgi:nitrite reductase (NADH) large subunit